MSVRNFRSVGWVAGIAATALGCYMVNLKVASERAALEDVETRIVLAERDIRLLQTEIGTRGRLAQLEKWNVKVLALSAPAANQFMEGSFQLATLVTPKKIIDPAAPVVLASAPAPAPKPVVSDDGAIAPAPAVGQSPAELMHVASMRREVPAASAAKEPKAKPAAVATKPVSPKTKSPSDKPAAVPKLAKADAKTIPAAKAVEPKSAKSAPATATASKGPETKPKLASAKTKGATAKPATKEVKAKQ